MSPHLCKGQTWRKKTACCPEHRLQRAHQARLEAVLAEVKTRRLNGKLHTGMSMRVPTTAGASPVVVIFTTTASALRRVLPALRSRMVIAVEAAAAGDLKGGYGNAPRRGVPFWRLPEYSPLRGQQTSPSADRFRESSSYTEDVVVSA